jgi:hypothetical protein
VPKFMLLINTDVDAMQANLASAAPDALNAEYFTYTQELIDAGAMLGGDPLEGPETGRIVSPGGVVTDGPFADTAEVLGGYYLVELPSIDEAVAWAAKLPGVARGFDRIEVRPVRVLPASMPRPS